jgi:hypothetical protein
VRTGGRMKKLLCISASNILFAKKSTSTEICKIIMDHVTDDYEKEILELRNINLLPCNGCGTCYQKKRCNNDLIFNKIYEKIISCNVIFIISPHYAPIPAKLCMLLEKMEQISFLHWGKDNNYKSEVNGIIAGIISHGGGSDWALESYRAMVNDTIANAFDTIQIKTIPFSEKWKTGISIPVKTVKYYKYNVFPCQEYDWETINKNVKEYVDIVFNYLLK